MTNHHRVGSLLLLLVGTSLVPGCRDDEGPTEMVLPPQTGGMGQPATGGSGPHQMGGSTGTSDAGAVTDGPVLPPFSKAGLITAIAECTDGRYNAFQTVAQTLQTRIAAYADTLAPADLTEAQAAWRTAMASWQEAELFLFGPAASSDSPGGQALRAQIYSYPNVFRCGVDRQIVNQAYASANFPNTFVNARGLDALEYLLFHTGPNNACTAGDNINTQGAWAALSATALQRRRADYAVAAIADVLARTQILVAAWQPNAANFRQQFVTAGAGSMLFATDQAALNAVSDGLLDYVDKILKDAKVAVPAGIDMKTCPTRPCTEALESPYARTSTDNIVNNILGFRRIFLGCGPNGAGFGFDDWLHAVGHGMVATRMETGIATALAAAQGLQPPLEDAILSSTTLPQVQSLYAAIKLFNDPLKADVLSALNLERSMTVEGDND